MYKRVKESERFLVSGGKKETQGGLQQGLQVKRYGKCSSVFKVTNKRKWTSFAAGEIWVTHRES